MIWCYPKTAKKVFKLSASIFGLVEAYLAATSNEYFVFKYAAKNEITKALKLFW